MLSPREFQDAYSSEELAEKLPDRPITSLRDVQHLYGTLYTLATAGGGEYANYLTPDQAGDLIDEPESLIVVRVDLSGDEPRLDETPVKVRRYTEDLVEKVAHCKYSAAKGIDHSITHRSGRNSDREKLARYAKERLTKWPTDDVVRSVAEEHDEGWIIDALSTLDDRVEELSRIDDEIERRLGGSTTALLTVRVRLDSTEKYHWPGEIDVFNEAMRARKLSKLVSKGEATESAGLATDLITGKRTRTVGTAEDPLNYYLGKQMETFPSFDPDEAWRTHPVSEDAAVTIMNAETFVNACTYPTFGATVYYLPYFLGNVSPEEAYLLYDVLYRTTESSDMTPVQHVYEKFGDDGIREHGPKLRFYVAAVMKHQMSRYDVFGDTLNGSIVHPVELAKSHEEILEGWAFDVADQRAGRISAPFPTSSEDWSLLHGGRYLDTVSTGAYFYATFSYGDDDQDASADDARIEALVSVLAGDPLPVEMLLSEYVDRLLDSEGESFPNFVVASQFAQLCALARTGLLTAENDETNETLTEAPTYDESMKMYEHDTRARTDGGAVAAERAEKLEQFIEGTPALEDGQRRGAFLLGALVGQIGGYQQGAGRSTTVVDQYPIKSMTKTRLKRVTQEVLDKNVVYSRENGMRSTMYAEVVTRLVETVTEADPDTWKISTDDLRFYYALGVAYGLNNWTESNEDNTEEDQND